MDAMLEIIRRHPSWTVTVCTEGHAVRLEFSTMDREQKWSIRRFLSWREIDYFRGDFIAFTAERMEVEFLKQVERSGRHQMPPPPIA